MRRRSICALLSLGLGACASSQSRVSAPRFEDEVRRIVDEEVLLTCDGDRSAIECELEARYELEPEPEPGGGVEVTVHHERIDTLELEQAGRRLPPLPPLEDEAEGLDRFELGSGKTLELHAHFTPRPGPRWPLVTTAALARHLSFTTLFGLRACSYDPGGCRFDLAYVRAQAPEQGGEQSSTLEVRAPASWTVSRQRQGDTERVTLFPGQRLFAPGGPLLGVGLGLDPRTGATELAKFRLGWELFAPSYVAHALVLEADGGGGVVLVPSTEIMSPQILAFPSLGLGLGLPMQLRPQPELGLRLQLSVQLPYVGVVATFDWYQSQLGASPRPSVYLQLAF